MFAVVGLFAAFLSFFRSFFRSFSMSMSVEDAAPVEAVVWDIAVQIQELEQRMRLLQRQFEEAVVVEETLPAEEEATLRSQLARIGEYVSRTIPHVRSVTIQMEQSDGPTYITLESRMVRVEEGSDYAVLIRATHPAARALVRRTFEQTAEEGEPDLPRAMKNAMRTRWVETRDCPLRYYPA